MASNSEIFFLSCVRSPNELLQVVLHFITVFLVLSLNFHFSAYIIYLVLCVIFSTRALSLLVIIVLNSWSDNSNIPECLGLVLLLALSLHIVLYFCLWVCLATLCWKLGKDVLGRRNGQRGPQWGGGKVWGSRNICSPVISCAPGLCISHISERIGREAVWGQEASGYSADLREAVPSPQQRCQREESCPWTQPPPRPAIGRCFLGKLRFLPLGS